ncbi:hypothetical protein PBCVNEJV1_671R [Paramecium bursaria Chlorella virus NE-JV-1]|nr:hypothetical protein PBCVNEJV1_671R [Paramecium bursaria Chlorella virus NE-JV-1]
MDALVVLDVLSSVVDKIEQLAGRKKCGCSWTGKGNYPKQYMKIGLPGGEKYWCEKCADVPPEAVHLDNSVCRTPGCKNVSLYTNNGTRDNKICGECRDNSKIVPEDEKNKYKDVVHPKCLMCEKTRPVFAIVPEGKTYRDVQPVLCGECVGKLPKDEQIKYKNVVNPRCQHDGCDVTAHYAEDFTGFPRRYCALHAPIGFVDIGKKLCAKCETNTIKKNKVPGVCARCDPKSNYAKYENAVLDILKEKYEIVTQFPVYGEGRTKYPLRLDGAVFKDDVIVAIEVDEKTGHNSAKAKELDAARMKVCNAYFEKKYSLPVAWIRIVPDISDKSLGKDKDQFGDIASNIRCEIVDRAMAKIDELLQNPASGVFYFKQ